MKILVIRLGRLGDMVMITPAMKLLAACYPQAKIDLVTTPEGRLLFNDFEPKLNKIIIYDRKSWAGYFIKQRLRKQCLAASYDHVICFEHNSSLRKLFSSVTEQFHAILYDDGDEHFSKRCLNTLKPLCDVAVNHSWANLTVDNEQQQQAKKYLHETLGIVDDDFVIGIHPSFSGMRKSIFRSKKARNLKRRQWALESFAQLAKQLANYKHPRGKKIKLLMSLLPDERHIGEFIVNNSQHAVELITPSTDFESYKARLQRFDLLISLNSGPMHIAAALRTSLVALYCGYDPRDCGPYMPAELYTAICAENFPDVENLGMNAIPLDAVYQACIEKII